VARYEYRCTTCDDVFEERRAMADADTGVTCPSGHTEVRRLLSVFASTGRASGSAPAPVAAAPMRGCGGGCACH
jgi:putative FmdB family regulatory protein